jgi:hypothetical protein
MKFKFIVILVISGVLVILGIVLGITMNIGIAGAVSLPSFTTLLFGGIFVYTLYYYLNERGIIKKMRKKFNKIVK